MDNNHEKNSDAKAVKPNISDREADFKLYIQEFYLKLS